ncbi:carbohydrate binding domain-containing protein [candidate division KSB1 bacterium]|nr:carbohydrate binding domain-containing protein [candidate division KSB1 bacterium]
MIKHYLFKTIIPLFLLNSLVFSQELSVKITEPSNGARLENCTDFNVEIEVQQGAVDIKTVEIYRSGVKIKSATRPPYRYTQRKPPEGIYEFVARVFDDEDKKAISNTVTVFVGNVADGNLLFNGEFNCEVWPWRLDVYEGAQATFEIWPDMALTGDEPGAYIDIREIGAQFWGVQLMQPFVLKQGHTYEISFAAEADDPKDIEINISQDYDPWAPIYAQKITVDEPQVYGPYTFECGVDDPKTMFKFVIGGNDIPIYIDAVQAIDLMWTDVRKNPHTEPPENFQLGQNYPNPFNAGTVIPYSLKQSGRVSFRIFNTLGEKVYSISENQSAGEHFLTWNGRDQNGHDVASGCYLYSVSVNGRREIRKMLYLR